MSSEAYVRTTSSNGIFTVTFFHPQSNSLPGLILNKLADEIQKAGKAADCKVIVLQSEGEKAFCAGASFDELTAIETLEAGQEFFSGFARVINAIRKVPRFVIARVQGKAVGGGVGLAAAADYTLAIEQASVKLSELAVGIGPFVVGPAVQRKVGLSAFSAMAINATEWFSAEWAREKGLYTETFPTSADLDAAIAKLAQQLASSSPEAMHELKKILWEGTENWEQLLPQRAGISGKLVLSDFTRTAISRFKSGSR